MRIKLFELALETTRRCNLKCAHCMRGPSQNINMPKQYVDMAFDHDEIIGIDHLLFSGGEPTLNPDLIIHAVDRIVNEKMNVHDIIMVTNGQIFNRDLIEAFQRFNAYRNRQSYESIMKHFGDDPELANNMIRTNTDKHVRVTFSTDSFHHPVSQEVRDLYSKYGKGLRITNYALDPENLFKTGFSKEGKEFTYQNKPISYFSSDDYYSVIDTLYLTAKGNITSEGMGQYTDMDQNHLGRIEDLSFMDLLIDHGKPCLKTPKLEREEVPVQYKKQY